MAIKKQPQDFIVDEVIAPAWLERIVESRADAAPFAVYLLQKTSLSTPEAVSLLARRIGVRPADVAYAGLKDKHGQTSQYVTIRTAGPDMPATPGTIEDQAWHARLLGFSPDPVEASLIRGNRFRITVRTLTHRDLKAMGVAARRLAPAGTPDLLRIVNYFGDQRFGSARAGAGEHGGFLAPLLIRGEFEEALRLAIAVPYRMDTMRLKTFKRAAQQHWGRWHELYRATENARVPERAAVQHLINHPGDYRGAFGKLPYLFQQMCVEAYQSLLWNRTARRLVEQTFAADRYLRAPDKFGDMLFPIAAAVPAPWLGMNLPVLGADSTLIEPWKPAAEAVLAEEGLTTAELCIPGVQRPWFGEAPRKLIVHAREFQIARPEPDELQTAAKRFKLTLSFELPRGSYATVVLRALGS